MAENSFGWCWCAWCTKTLSKSGFKHANCLLSLTRCQGIPALSSIKYQLDECNIWGTDSRQRNVDYLKLEMWDSDQRDGRPTEYRWCPLFNVAQFGWRPLLECRAVTLPRLETCWNLQGCPKLANRSQPLVGRSSPYCEDMWGRHCCLTGFFSDCRYVP